MALVRAALLASEANAKKIDRRYLQSFSRPPLRKASLVRHRRTASLREMPVTDHKSMPADLRCRTEASDAGLASTELRRSDDASALQSGAHSGQCSTIIFCGDAEQVSAGFALALNMMEVHADLLITTLQPTSQHG